jgi:hypothetical protein
MAVLRSLENRKLSPVQCAKINETWLTRIQPGGAHHVMTRATPLHFLQAADLTLIIIILIIIINVLLAVDNY